MKNKGQALVEFVIIMPIFMMLVLAIVDFGKIMYQRYQLENVIDQAAALYNQNELEKMNEYLVLNDVEFTIQNEGDFELLMITREISISSPALNLVLGEYYSLSVDQYLVGDSHES